ncbi:MAG: two-component system sensor histidine kinase NtrB, partial [bacterium]
VMVAAEQPEEVRAETMGIVRNECARLNRLLTNLLDFARPRKPEWREVDVQKVMDAVTELVRHSAGKNIQFEVNAGEQLPALLGDEEQIAQVMLNLTLNAAQAMPDGGKITLTAAEKADGVLIEVRDEGIGILPQDIEKIFDPFFTTKDTGTGLGLSVVHQIVTQLGGTISVTRNEERGMTFSLFFPPSSGKAA